VIAFVGDHLANLLDLFIPALGLFRRCFELLGRLGQRLLDRRRVALIGPFERHRHDCTRFQIDGVLGFVRQMRAPVLHFRHPRVGIPGMLPIFVGRFVLALLVDFRQLLAGRRLDAGLARQPPQVLLVAFAGVAPDERAQRRVGLQRGGVDGDGPAGQQPFAGQQRQRPAEHGAMGFQIEPAAGARQRRMIRRRLVELVVEEAPQRQRIGDAPGDGALGIEAFEVADEQATEVDAGGQRGPAERFGVEGSAELFGVRIEAVLVEQRVELGVERVRRRARQVGCGQEEIFLALPSTAATQRHARL